MTIRNPAKANTRISNPTSLKPAKYSDNPEISSASSSVAPKKSKGESGTKMRIGYVDDGRVSDRAKAYALRRVIAPRESKTASAVAVGYGKYYRPALIEQSESYQSAMDELQALAKSAKCTPGDQLAWFAQVRDNKLRDRRRKVGVTHSLDAAKEINRMMGYHAPDRQEITNSSTQFVGVIHEIRASGQSLTDLLRSVSQSAQVVDVMDSEDV